MTENQDMDLLLYRYLDGECSDAEVMRLREEIRRQPELAERLFLLSEELTDLMDVTRENDADFRQPAFKRGRVARRTRLVPLAIAAGIAAVAATWLMIGIVPSERPDHASGRTPSGNGANKPQAVAQAGTLAEKELEAVLAKAEPGTPIVAEIVNRVTVFTPKTRTPMPGHESGNRPAQPGMALHERDKVDTGERGSLTLVYAGEKTRVETRSSVFTVQETKDGGKGIYLEKGELTAVVAKQPKGRPMAFTTRHGEVRVLGTTFSLWATSAFTRALVREGTVDVVAGSDNAREVVGAGYYCDITTPDSGHHARRRKPVVLPVEALLYRPGRTLWETDFESETENAKWVAYAMQDAKGIQQARPITEPGETLRFRQMDLGGRESVVMVMNGRALARHGGSLAVYHPEVQACMASSYVLEYDEYGLGPPTVAEMSDVWDTENKAWHRVSILMKQTPRGLLRLCSMDGRIVSGGLIDERATHIAWLEQFVFKYVRGIKMTDNMCVREVVAQKPTADTDR